VIDIHTTDDPQSPPSDQQPATSPLSIFHSALGMPPPKPPKPVRTLFGSKKPAPPQPILSSKNRGVYALIVANERSTRLRYQSCDIFISVAMFLQIIVGATVTAFGAGSANHTLITVFGAANTALASLLAVLKSQGLPNRLRQDWNGWRELKEYVEERERALEMWASGRVKDADNGKGKEIDIWAEIKNIEARYNAVRLTAEANRPDTYIKVPAETSSEK